MKRVGDLLREFLKQRGWPAEDPYAILFSAWSEMAGADLSAHSRLVEVEDGVLVVEVDHPGWLQMLQLRRAAILEAARRAAPQTLVKGVRGRLAFAHGGR